jgi:hypothetical protein
MYREKNHHLNPIKPRKVEIRHLKYHRWIQIEREKAQNGKFLIKKPLN